MNPSSLFAIGLALPLLGGGNFFAFVTPWLGILCFALLVVTVIGQSTADRPADVEQGPRARVAVVAALALSIWWTGTLILRASGPRAPIEAVGLSSGVLLFAALAQRTTNASAVWSFTRGLLLGALATAAYGQYQYWIAFPRTAPVLSAMGIPTVQLVNANFYNANCYAAFLVPTVLLGAAFAFVARGTTGGTLATVATALLCGTLLLSESRAAVALLIVTVASAVVVGTRDSLRLQTTVVAASIIGVFIVGAAAAVVDFRELWSVAFIGRLAIWEAAARMIRDHWLTGVGLGGFAAHFPEYQVTAYYTRYPHNFILEIFAELGIVGLGSLLTFLAAAIVPFRRFFASDALADGERGAAELAITVGTAALLVHALIDIDWHSPANPILLFVLLGFAQRAGERPAVARP
jgi:O-antigen ligase